MASLVDVYDTTLRDGTQGEGVSLSVTDKLNIAKRLDRLGVAYIEGGWPGSNPKDMSFFEEVKQLNLTTSKIAAFGSTRRSGIDPKDDGNLARILESGAQAAAIFGKAWDFHVTEALKTTKEENLKMIEDSISYLKANGLEVIFDAEHFFDGFKANPDYAMAALYHAERGGADCLVLCDTNGGALPQDVQAVVSDVTKEMTAPVGIHCHNDGELAVANSIAAVEAGAKHVQGTVNGYGERCGNANLISVIPNLQLKLGFTCLSDERIAELTETAKSVHDIANQVPPSNQPFVGRSAFAHKGGMHVNAVQKHPETYEHMQPEAIGNERRVLVSELAGQSNLYMKAEELGIDIDPKSGAAKTIIEQLKELENAGYQYEAAEASFELLIRRGLGETDDFFALDHFKIITERNQHGDFVTEAVVKLQIDNQPVMTAAEGNGPVNALDNALRKALKGSYPLVNHMYLADYKVRVLDETEATASKVRVLIESSDGRRTWSTVGVSTNIIEASWHALVDSIRYYFMKEEATAADEETPLLTGQGVCNH
ncbi:2-isopropylmalate synthase [Salsuginibacillus halophilus]|uniref:Citramalate synthase n=1 Tax=Salsuginibacillus halophilus TaxID=517424 RepID=A0A2P8HAM3_9BACI|nr:citramalate synthase [Salsuginibacillus halophilus]PSL43273.1 2-isopropylmalate synthase [Salsuginibacillus halophilus]